VDLCQALANGCLINQGLLDRGGRLVDHVLTPTASDESTLVTRRVGLVIDRPTDLRPGPMDAVISILQIPDLLTYASSELSG
jgi:hypothetical protein